MKKHLITQAEVCKVAQIAAIHIEAHEIPKLTHDLNAVISYAEGLYLIAATSGEGKNTWSRSTPPDCAPYVRPDIAHTTDSAPVSAPGSVGLTPLVALGNRTENNYFVVPVIVKGA